MRVQKRNGEFEDVKFDKVTQRIERLSGGLEVSPVLLAQKVLANIYDGIKTSDIDNISADIAVTQDHPDYHKLASRIIVSNMHKTTETRPVEGVTIYPERDYLLDYFGLKTLQKMYLLPGETPQHMFARVALAVSPDDPQVTYDAMSQKYYIHATPTLFNAGTHCQQLSSCFLVAMKDDSIDGIYDTKKECARISKMSGGIGLHIHNVRAKGSKIRGTNGVSDGIIPMLRTLNADARYVNQGGKRKGSYAVYIEPWHADIMDFLEIKLNQGDEEARCRDLFPALWIPDLFMERLECNQDWSLFCPDEAPGLADVYGQDFNELYQRYESEGRARKVVPIQKIWMSILKSQVETGTPYMLYKDACNRKSNQKNLGTIKSSNLCVAPETKILTKKGYLRISDLYDQQVEIWNGIEWSLVTIHKTSDSSKLVRVNFSDGTFLECTEYHKFHLQIGYGSKKEVCQARELTPGDKLIKWIQPHPIEYGDDVEYDAYTHGFFCGDGTYHSTYSGQKTIPGVSLYGEKKNLIEYLDVRSTSGNEDSSSRINIMLHYNLPPKFNVPSDKSLKTRIDWFAGLCDADGHVQGCPGNPTQKSISVASIHISFLREIQLMLHTLGVSSVIGLLRDAGETELPDGRGGKRVFNTQTCWRLVVSALGIETLINNGFDPKRLDLSDFTPVTRDVRQYVRVVSVEDNSRTDSTYCFNEPKKHMGIFNGVIAGNCTEIIEHTDADNTAVCNLASLGLPTFVRDGEFDFEKLEEITRLAVRNLNNVIDINWYPTDPAKNSNFKNRPVALGVQGLADVYAILGLEFGYGDLNRNIFETIYYAAVSESMELAKKFGPYQTFQGSPASKGKLQFDLWNVCPTLRYDWGGLKRDVVEHGMRNSLLVGPMPTATTSQILGFNECFEPFTSNFYLRRTLAGEFVVVNKYLMNELISLGVWTKELKNTIIKNNGSIQDIPDIPDHVKQVYRTVWEISPRLTIDMAAERGPYICQSQSMNLFVDAPTNGKLSSIHMYAWKHGLKTGMYYLRTKSKAKAIQFTLDPSKYGKKTNAEECTMCSA
jgi:ribonucleoside-diphosphate reductase alpha chain